MRVSHIDGGHIMSERKKYIDIAKGIGILLVLIGHIDWGNYILTNTIYSFHMPLFMMVSGYLFHFTVNKYTFFANLKSRITRLVIQQVKI